MQGLRKRILSLVLALSLFSAWSVTALADYDDGYDGDSYYYDDYGYYDDSISVIYNDRYLYFYQGEPKLENGRVMAPFRELLEGIGAKVTYNNTSKMITASLDGTAISFQPGDARLSVTAEGKTTHLTMDTIPYLDKETNTTYVSVRLLSEAFGFSVAWENDLRTVIIANFAPLLQKIEGDFTIIDKLYQTDFDMSKTYRSAVAVNLVLESLMEENPFKIPLSMKATVVQKGMDADGTIVYSLDLTDILTQEDKDGLSEEEQALFELLKNVEIRVKIDSAELAFYIKSNLFAIYDLLGEESENPLLDSDTWIKISAADLTEMYKNMGIAIDFEQLFQATGPTSFSEMLAMQIEAAKENLSFYTYSALANTINLCKTFLGDEVFTKTVNGNKTTYSIVAGDAMLKAFFLGASTEMDDAKYSLVITETNGKLSSYSAALAFREDENSFSIACTGTAPNNAKCQMELVIGGSMRLALDMTATCEETTEIVSSKPADGEKVITLSELLGESGLE